MLEVIIVIWNHDYPAQYDLEEWKVCCVAIDDDLSEDFK